MDLASRLRITCAAGVLITAACAPAGAQSQDIDALVQQGLRTAQAQMTVEAGAASGSPAPAASGNTFAFGDFGISISFTYPAGFAEGALAESLPGMAIQDPGDPEYPEHARILLTGYAREGRSNIASGIRVFRADEVNTMDPAVIASLKAVLAGTSEDRLDFPRIPAAGRTVDAQAEPVDFVNGHGYRFLAQGSFDASTLRSTRLYYIYQGLTADEMYLVTVLLGTDAPFVADLATGEPIMSQEIGDAYLIDLNQRINAAQAADFSPSLGTLDGLVQSLNIIEQ
jgi:hypothetical protein